MESKAIKGRPREKEIDLDVIEALAKVGCTQVEIAWEMGIKPSHFCDLKKERPEIQDALDRGHANLRKSLRAKQVEVAVKEGNPQLLIFLGKAILDQKDKVEVDQKISGDVFVVNTAFTRAEKKPESDEDANTD